MRPHAHICRYCASFNVGPLYIQAGGMTTKLGPLRLWDGLHLWWGAHGLHLFWSPSPFQKRISRDYDASFASSTEQA